MAREQVPQYIQKARDLTCFGQGCLVAFHILSAFETTIGLSYQYGGGSEAVRLLHMFFFRRFCVPMRMHAYGYVFISAPSLLFLMLLMLKLQ